MGPQLKNTSRNHQAVPNQEPYPVGLNPKDLGTDYLVVMPYLRCQCLSRE